MFRNNLTGPVNLVKLPWKSRSQLLFEKKLFGLLYPTWTSFSEKICSNSFRSCFEWKHCAVSENTIFMSFIYLHFSNCKFLTFCSIDWFRFQNPLQLAHFRYQDAKIFGTKVWGGSLDFNLWSYLRHLRSYFNIYGPIYDIYCLIYGLFYDI